MPENLELEMGKLFKASQERYVYFLLAAAASAIGFAMTQSKFEPLGFIHIPFLWDFLLVYGL